MEYLKKVDDKQLIENIQNGDEESFEILYKKYISRLFKFVNGIIQSHHLSEEIVQETFLKLYINIHKYKITDTKFSTFLYKIAYNTTINTIKSLNMEKNIVNDLYLDLKNRKHNNDPYYLTEIKETKKIIDEIIMQCII